MRYILIFTALIPTLSIFSQNLEVEGKMKIAKLENVDSADSLVVWLPDSTLGIRESSTLNIQLKDADGDTRISVELNPDDDTIRVLVAGQEFLKTGGKSLKVGSTGGSIYIGRHAGENTPAHQSGNVFIGAAAGVNNSGSFSTAVGDSALFMSTTTGRMTAFGHGAGMHSNDSLSTYLGFGAGKNSSGNRSVHIGYDAGSNDQGTSNIAIGAFAGNDDLTGSANVFIGKSSGSANTTGESNTFIGEASGLNNTDGEYNTFVGRVAGSRNSKGNRNTFIGAFSGGNPGIDSLGDQNTFIGVASGSKLTSGQRNVFAGDGAGFTNSTGNRNTFIGENAGSNNSEGNDNTYIGKSAGSNAIGSGNVFLGSYAGYHEMDSNKLYIDNDSTNTPLIYGDFANSLTGFRGRVGIGTKNPKASLHAKDDGVAGERTIVGVLESNISDRPTLLFSEFPTSGIENGMSIEYNGAGAFVDGRMDINKSGGDPIITFRNTGAVGIGTTDPKAGIHVDSSALFTGNLNLSNSSPLPASGPGVRMMWYPDKAVFRAGRVNADQWDNANLGQFSSAFGQQTKASGNSTFASGAASTASGDYSTAMGNTSTAAGLNSTALGSSTTASGDYSTVMGNNNIASGNYSTAMGRNTVASGLYSFSTGRLTKASGLYSSTMGFATTATGFACTVIGMHNDTVVAVQDQSTDQTPLFIIGNGNNNIDKSNAMVVRKDGKVGIGTSNPAARLEIQGSSIISDSLAIGLIQPKAKFHIKDDGVAGERTIVGVLESNISDRPTLLFSEFPSSGINNGMSIEYNGAGAFTDDRMDINKSGGDPIVTFRNTGKVGIGTTNPNEMLEVNGGNVRVSGGSFIDDGTTLNVPDYVFDKQYELKTLPEVADFIENNHHLEGFPAMDDLKGWSRLSLQARDMKLLEKVEELYLHLIDQAKKIQSMQEELNRISRENQILRERK